MGDQTLLDFDIIYEAKRKGLLVPFDERQLKGASYDIRAGDQAIVVRSEQEGGYHRVSLKDEEFIDIAPGETAVIYSLERLGIPATMKGRLSLRSFWAIKGLYYNGGVVDPGYTGLLFFNVTNLGSGLIHIAYGEGLVTAEFIRLDQPSQKIYNDGIAAFDVSDSKLPPIPQHAPASLSALSARVDELAARIGKLEQRGDDRSTEPNQG